MTDIYSPAGVDVTAVTSSQDFALGQQAEGGSGSNWLYVAASNSVTQYDAVAVKSNFAIAPLTITNAKTAVEVAFAQVAVGTKGNHTWVQKNGRPIVRFALAAQADVPLYATSAGGVLDDASTSAMIAGLVAITEVTDSAGTATCVARYPTVIAGKIG